MEKEHRDLETTQIFSRRVFLLRAVLVVPFGTIFFRLWNLQITHGKEYQNLSLGNRIRLLPVGGARGIIYDKNGIILAKNIPTFNLIITLKDCPDIENTLGNISRNLHIPYPDLIRIIQNNKDIPDFKPIRLYTNLSWQQIAPVNTFYEDYPGVSVEVTSRRYYPYKKTFSHILGYMSKIDKEEIKKLSSNQVSSAVYVGKEGIERFYNRYLLGRDGGIQVEVDNRGRVINRRKSKPPTSGHALQLSVDQRLQVYVEKKIFNNNKGIIIVSNPNTGEILAMTSQPSFDPNIFSLPVSNKQWKYFLNHPGKILNNRSIQGIYSPGSAFKMLIALAALEEKIIDEKTTFFCNGSLRVYGKRYACWKTYGHGRMNVIDAIGQSCNVFFYNLGKELGIDRIYKYGKKFGFGEKTNIDLINEITGIMPNPQWKKKNKNSVWYGGETISVSIGQGYVAVTPMQMIVYLNTLVNGGNIIPPSLVGNIIPSKGTSLQRKKTEKNITNVNINPYYLELIRKGMEACVNDPKGTAFSSQNTAISMAGKTGTTQVISLKAKQRLLQQSPTYKNIYENHAWFVGYAPYYKPEVSICLLIEHGKSGRIAAQLAGDVLTAYFKNNFT